LFGFKALKGELQFAVRGEANGATVVHLLPFESVNFTFRKKERL